MTFEPRGFNPQNFVFSFFKDGSTVNMGVDGSTPVNYDYTCPAGKMAQIQRINFLIIDGGIQPTKFGGIAALGNGLTIKVYDNSDVEKLDFLDGEVIATIADFQPLAGIDISLDTGAGDDAAYIRWTISKAGSPLTINENDYIRIKVQDNLSTMTKFVAMVQGIYVNAAMGYAG